MTELETLYRIKQIIKQNKVWMGRGYAYNPLPEYHQRKIEELVDGVLKKRPQNDPDPTEPSCACPDERPAQT